MLNSRSISLFLRAYFALCLRYPFLAASLASWVVLTNRNRFVYLSISRARSFPRLSGTRFLLCFLYGLFFYIFSYFQFIFPLFFFFAGGANVLFALYYSVKILFCFVFCYVLKKFFFSFVLLWILGSFFTFDMQHRNLPKIDGRFILGGVSSLHMYL